MTLDLGVRHHGKGRYRKPAARIRGPRPWAPLLTPGVCADWASATFPSCPLRQTFFRVLLVRTISSRTGKLTASAIGRRKIGADARSRTGGWPGGRFSYSSARKKKRPTRSRGANGRENDAQTKPPINRFYLRADARPRLKARQAALRVQVVQEQPDE